MSMIDLPSFDVRYYRDKEFLRLLCEDIEKEGMLVNPIVRKKPDGRYEIVDGINRIKCAQKLGWESINCEVLAFDSDIETIVSSLKINLNRKSNDPVGVAESFQRLRDLGMKQVDIAKRFGFSKAHISKLLKINDLSPEYKLKLARGELSIPQAYNFAKTKRDPELMERLQPKYECNVCKRKIGLGSIEVVQLCSEYERKLKDLLSQEQRKQRAMASTQRELPR